MAKDLVINDDITIPAEELDWRFLPAGGPGGQHANRSATRAEVSLDIGASRAFDPETRRRLIEKLGAVRVTISADDTRSQWRNRQIARRRLADQLRGALRTERPRVATRPSLATRKRRREAKRRRAETKKLRRRPGLED